MPRTDNSHGFEWRSGLEFYGYPLLCVAVGRDENGRMRVAKGWIAVGQFAIGLITFAQVGIGLLFGFGQCIFGITAVAQAAITVLFGVGQIVTGYVAIGQLAVGYYVIAQVRLDARARRPGRGGVLQAAVAAAPAGAGVNPVSFPRTRESRSGCLSAQA
jgi:hypothetical protein